MSTYEQQNFSFILNWSLHYICIFLSVSHEIQNFHLVSRNFIFNVNNALPCPMTMSSFKSPNLWCFLSKPNLLWSLCLLWTINLLQAKDVVGSQFHPWSSVAAKEYHNCLCSCVLGGGQGYILELIRGYILPVQGEHHRLGISRWVETNCMTNLMERRHQEEITTVPPGSNHFRTSVEG